MTDRYERIRKALAMEPTPCSAHGRTPMTTNTMGRDEAVECPECGRKWPWESEQAVAVGLQGACIACTMKYPDGTHEESQRRYSLIAAPKAQASTEAWRDLAIANGDIVDEIRDVVGLTGKPGDVVEAVRELVALSRPAEGEEIMVSTPYDVFILPLRPSGLDGKSPRFVVHVPGPEAQAAEARGVVDERTSNARGEVEYEYEVWQGDALQAGGSTTDYASAQSEASHYVMMYNQDGPVEIIIYEKRRVAHARRSQQHGVRTVEEGK